MTTMPENERDLKPARLLAMVATTLCGVYFASCGLTKEKPATDDSANSSSQSGAQGPAGPAGTAGERGERGESYKEASHKLLTKLKPLQRGVLNLQCGGASGSGTRISQDTVITAYHVLNGASSCVVRSSGQQVGIGNQLSRSPSGRDIGYIRGLTFNFDVPIISPAKGKIPLVGDMLVLMSYPSFLTNDLQLTLGFVTDDNVQNSLEEMSLEWRDAIVSDMSAGSGSSGGPVFNEDGEFVGIHVGGFSGEDGGGTELNFQLMFQPAD
ncbi:MAG: serine protease [Proteobacteria bacterium]|nr:serine protease [Pseudomonadota bacterium]